MKARRTIVAGNWKMNLRRDEVVDYCRRLADEPAADGAPEIVLFPSQPFVGLLAAELASTAIAWGGQDLHPEDAGAHTGDTSALQLADFGCRWALCGHSERRADWKESDELVAAKVAAATRNGLQPMLCVGEKHDERDAGRTEAVLERQLLAAMPPAGDAWTLAYEPVWAIGTGLTATPEIAQQAHAFLRSRVRAERGDAAADELRILYGGSVKPDNAHTLFAQPDIDGGLIGGASLKGPDFLAIARAAADTA